MKKILLPSLLLASLLMEVGCNNPRDVKEMLQEKGHKCLSVIKADSIMWYNETISDKEYRFHKLEMEIDSTIKSIPDKFNYAYEKRFDKEMQPIAAACYTLQYELTNEKIKESYSNDGKKQSFVGMNYLVKMSVYGRVDEYWVRTNKNVNKILYIAPAGHNNYNIMFRNGVFGTLR